MTPQPRVWVLNLDAEHELEAQHSYAPTLHLRAIVAREQRRLVGTLVAPGDIVLSEDDLASSGRDVCRGGEAQAVRPTRDAREPRRTEGLPGIAWCPTPRALARLAAAGAQPISAPSVEILRAVNARPFAALVRAPFAGASFEKDLAHSLEHALELLARAADDGWLVRRTFGAAGRGRRRIAAGAPTAAELAWLIASLRLGPLVVEPWVRVTREYTRSAWVHPGGEVVISAPCSQETTAQGAWVRTERAERGDVSRDDDARLAEMVEVAGRALAETGYFGPFGIDAYRHRVAGRAGDVLNPLSEINARFTMDWAEAMAADPSQGDAIVRLQTLVEASSLGQGRLQEPAKVRFGPQPDVPAEYGPH